MKREVFYLHGFTSSAQSSKAGVLRERLRTVGIELRTPDFNEPDFHSLTVTRMIEQTLRAIDELAPGPVALIGSSLGAFVAIHTAARGADGERPIDRLVLLAPAVDFCRPHDPNMPPDAAARWRDRGVLDVFHHSFGEMRTVDYALYADAQRYDAFRADVRVPTLVIQGRRDVLVDPAAVERFAAARPNVTLHLVDDDHQLLGSLDFIWNETARFLELV